MNKLRVGATFILIVMVVIIAMFQMDIRGYEEVERINEWVLYYSVETNSDDMLNYDNYIVKSGFSEKSLVDAIEEGLFNDDELDEIENLIKGLNDE